MRRHEPPVPQSFNSGSDSTGKHPVSTPCHSLSAAPSTQTPPLIESLPRFPPGQPRIAAPAGSKSGCCWRRAGRRSPRISISRPSSSPASAFGAQPQTTDPGHVMKCRVLSCDVMIRRPAPLRRPRRSVARPNSACRSSFRFRSVRAATGLPAARPFFARIACARAPAFAPARFARLIARAWTNAGRTSLSVPLGFFRTGARRETKPPPDAASSCLILPRFCRGQALTGNYFIIRERIATSALRASSSPTPAPSSPIPQGAIGGGPVFHSGKALARRHGRPPHPASPRLPTGCTHLVSKCARCARWPGHAALRPDSSPPRRRGPSMAPDAAATGGEQGEPPAAAAKTKAGPRLGGRGDGRGHAIQSQRKQMCESGSPQAGRGASRQPPSAPPGGGTGTCHEMS